MSITKRLLHPYLASFAALASLLILSGCAHYTAANSSDIPFRTLYIRPVVNNSYAPQVQALLSDNLVKAFLRDGSVKIVPQKQADATLRVVINEYKRSLFATQSNDSERARSFIISIGAKIKLSDNRTKKIYLKSRGLKATTTTYSEDEQGTAFPEVEYQTMPMLTRRLAATIRDAVLHVW